MTLPVAQPPAPGLGWLFFGLSGRISRLTFFKGWAFWASLMAATIAAMVAGRGDDLELALATLALIVIVPVAAISMLCLGAKRARDMGTSGWVTLLLLLPGVGEAMLIALMIWPGRDGGAI